MEELLEKHKAAILSWIKSSETEEQMDLLLQIISEFIITKFKGKVTTEKLEDSKNELLDAMANRKADIIGKHIIWK